MPFVDRFNQPLDPGTAAQAYGIPDEDAEGETPSFGETLRANFRVNNVIVSAIQSKRFGSSEVAGDFDPNFNPWDSIKGTPDEEDWPRYVDARNAGDLENIRADVASERQAQDVINRSGLLSNLVTGGLAGVADPLIFAPGMVPVRGAKLGLSALKTALTTGALSMGVAGTQEALLHATQQTRTAEESAVNVFTAGVVGTILGGALAKAMNRAEVDGIARKMMAQMAEGQDGNPDAGALGQVLGEVNRVQTEALNASPVSGGSAATPVPKLSDLEVDGAVAKRIQKIAQFSPVARALSWSSAQARSMMFRLAENSVYLSGVRQGKTTGPAVENLVAQWNKGVMSQVIEAHGGIYSEFRKAGGKLSRSDFNAEVGRAMRRGDQSADPHVAQAAKIWREQVINPLTQRAIKAGLLPEDVSTTTAQSYFSRVYNRKRLAAEEGQFKTAVKEHYRTKVSRADFDTDAERESYISDIADSVFDKLTGRGGEFGFDFQKVTVSSRGPLKERTFNIPDEVIERWLDSDVERVGHRFTRVMAADVELAEAFPESVDAASKKVTLHGPLQKVRDEYRKLREEVIADADPKMTEAKRAAKLTALGKEETAAIKDIEAVRDLLRGTFAQSSQNTTWARVSRIASTFNYVRMMGDVVKSSLTDTARPMMVHGLSNYFSGMNKLLFDPAFRKIAKAEARRAGAIGQRALEARLAAWGDITDPYLADTPFERFAGNAAKVFSKASGIGLWNDWMKTVSAAVTEDRLTKNIMKPWASLADKERRYMAYLGIDEGMAERMRVQVEKSGGGLNDGFWHSGTDEWTDEVAKRTFWAGIDKDVNSVIVTPGVGDLPLFQRSDLGRLLLQFKSYTIASHQKALIRAVQEGGNGQAVGVLMGMMSSVSIGMFISYLTAIETNRIDDMSGNPGTWIAEGVDRSGMLSMLMEVNNTYERFVPGMGLYGLLEAPFGGEGTGGASRFGYRPLSSLLTGPTGGTLDDFSRVFSDPKKALTLLPGRTLPYVRPILEWGVRPELSANE